MSRFVTGKRATFVKALVAGEGIADAAAKAGVRRRTGYRWLRDEAVQETLGKVLDAELAALAASTLGKSRDAAERLHTIMGADDTPPYVQVSAARALFDAGLKLYELRTLGMRMDRIEERLATMGLGGR